MVKINKMLVPNRKNAYSGTNPCNYITIHETANQSKGANAKMHAVLQVNGFTASWHYTCGSDGIWQSYPDTVKCWHGGDGRQGIGNTQSIGIEICVNSDGDFNKAVNNAAELVKHLMKKHNIPKKNVIQHNRVSSYGKDCPHFLRNGGKGITWNDFLKMIDGVKVEKADKPKTKPAKTSKWNDVGSKWTGQVLRLNDRGGAVKQLQKLVGVTADGMYGANTQTAVKKAQKKAGIAVDGMAGKDTLNALKSGKVANLSVDGKWGRSTTKAAQKSLGTTADGIISNQNHNKTTDSKHFYSTIKFGNGSSPFVKALQKRVGVGADGLLGPSTIKGIQRHVGTKQDSIIGPATIKAMQQRLNKGTF